jgi:hypothetical protein
MWSLALTNAKPVWPALAVEGSQRSRPNRSTAIRLTTLMLVKYLSTMTLMKSFSIAASQGIQDSQRSAVLHQRRQ